VPTKKTSAAPSPAAPPATEISGRFWLIRSPPRAPDCTKPHPLPTNSGYEGAVLRWERLNSELAATMSVLGIDDFERDPDGVLVSRPLPVEAFNGRHCRFELEGYDGDLHQGDFLEAVGNLLGATPSLLHEATGYVQQYCMEMLALWGDDAPKIDIKRPENVWDHVDLGNHLIVSRDHGPGRDIYVSLECSCAWEVEHGLQLVFENGRQISKVGPFDGHVSNASAYDDQTLRGVIYKSIAE
jgi:hypothetical protein